MAGLLMTRNLTREVARALDIRRFGLEKVANDTCRPIPRSRIEIPQGLDLDDIDTGNRPRYKQAIGGRSAFRRAGQQQLGGGRHHDA